MNRDGNRNLHDFNTFVVAHSHHAKMIKEWKRDIEIRRKQARNYLISGEGILEIPDDETRIKVVTAEIPTSPLKTQATVVPPVITTTTVSLPSKTDIIKKYTLNTQQKYAFMIIAGHLDGGNQICAATCCLDFATTTYNNPLDTNDNQLMVCVPVCGGTGKSQLIRAINGYFQLTKRGKTHRKLAPTSIAAAEIDGLTIHSFLG